MSANINDGGPAFPVPIQKINHDTRPDDFRETGCEGMTLRDWFAGKALAGIANLMINKTDSELPGIPVVSPERFEWIACIAYMQADAMLKARNQ